MIIAVSGSTLLNVYMNGAITVAIPSIGEDLDFTQSDLTWPLQAFSLTSGCLLLLTGRLADKYGRRPVFLIGTALFTFLSIPPIFCPEPVSFNTMMGLVGIGAAMMTSSGMGILGSNLEGALKNRAIAVMAGGQSIGFILGLLSAGFLCQLHRGWRWIFVIQVALGGIFLLAGIASVPKDVVKYNRALDWPGVVLSSSGLVLLIFSLSWKVAYIPTLFALSIVILVAFVLWEHNRDKKGHSVLLKTSIFKDVQFLAFFVLIFFIWWNFNVLQYFVTVYYQDVQHLSPAHTGIRFIPESLSGVVVNTATGWLVEYVPGQWLNAFGVGTTASSAIFAVIDPHVSYWRNAFWVVLLLPGADSIYTVGNLFVLTSMPSDSQALAGGLFATGTRIATSIGLAITSAIASGVSNHDDSPWSLLKGYRAAGWTCFAASCVGLVVHLVWLRGVGVMGGKRGVRLGDEEGAK
ncbi:MFS general substrate transporter [Neolentinus lepideus HHB14362 ss-1]|uniref:MFS general substrate transporter n=1 Tax=Neolentinus lepideus HHB14362 ss-1 TaxID=1314782 RepID=A0A165T2S4_9AGAM|nr:MFS general substrate transporter [Neolentinus lepideus HHB14362 ss-1]